jgi:hypothetical protein
MRPRALALIAAAVLVLPGCGDRHLVIKVDVLSYLDDAQRHVSVAALPPGTLPAPVPVVPDVGINLLEGLGDVAEIQSVTLSFGAQVSAGSGSGTGLLRLYLSGEDTDPLTTSPVVDVPIAFAAGAPAVASADVACAPAVAQLFATRRLRLAVVVDSATVAPPGATGVTVTLQRLDAVVIARRKGL